MILKRGQVVTFEAPNPLVNSRAGYAQKPTDTEFVPPLEIEFNDLLASLRALGITVGVEQRQLLGRGGWELAPKAFDGGMRNAVVQSRENNPGQFATLKAVVKAFEPLEFLHHGLGHSTPATGRADVEMAGQQAGMPAAQSAVWGVPIFRDAAGFPQPAGPVRSYQRITGRMIS